MPISVKLPNDDTRVIAFAKYQQTDEYANTRQWALKEANVEGSLWAAFIEGWSRKPSDKGNRSTVRLRSPLNKQRLKFL